MSVILCPAVSARLTDAAPSLKIRAALSISHGVDLRASEVVSLRFAAIESSRIVIQVEQGKACKDCHTGFAMKITSTEREQVECH